MKLKSKTLALLGLTVALLAGGLAYATNLTYSTPAIQSGDSDEIKTHKTEVALTNANLGNSYKNLTTATTTVIKASPGILDKVIINTAGSSTPTITIYDNASAGSGTKIATASAAAQGTLSYNVAFANGCTIVTGGTAGDYTISYR